MTAVSVAGGVRLATPHGAWRLPTRQDPIFHRFDAPARLQNALATAECLPILRSWERHRSGKPDTYRNQSLRRLICRLSSQADGFSLSSLDRESLLLRTAKAIAGKLEKMGDS
jgi:hypothetical protein